METSYFLKLDLALLFSKGLVHFVVKILMKIFSYESSSAMELFRMELFKDRKKRKPKSFLPHWARPKKPRTDESDNDEL